MIDSVQVRPFYVAKKIASPYMSRIRERILAHHSQLLCVYKLTGKCYDGSFYYVCVKMELDPFFNSNS
jgi:hypothetical protein